MGTANKNNIVKRIDVDRKLSFQEMDTNFEQLKLVIDDATTVETQLSNKVETSVYDTKIAEIDTSITNLETNTVSEGYVTLIDDRVTVNEGNISTLQTNVSSNDTDIANIDSRVTVNEGDISTLQTDVSSNEVNIANLDSRVTTTENNIASNDTEIATLNTDVDEALVPTWTSISTSQTLQVNTRYSVDFTAGILTLTLPLSPAANDFIRINKGNGTSEDSIIARNGQTIMGIAEDMRIDFDAVSINLVYNGTDWRIL